jgi:predicted transcriptional regulator
MQKKKYHEQDAIVRCHQSHLVDAALWNMPVVAVSANASISNIFILHHHGGISRTYVMTLFDHRW